MTHSYRELTATELCTWFLKITGGTINKGRDAHMLSRLMEEEDYSPTQILEGFYFFATTPVRKDIPNFVRGARALIDESQLVAEAHLYEDMRDQPLIELAIYLDLLGEDIPSAVTQQALEETAQKLKDITDDAFERPASLSAGKRAAGQRQQYGAPE